MAIQNSTKRSLRLNNHGSCFSPSYPKIRKKTSPINRWTTQTTLPVCVTRLITWQHVTYYPRPSDHLSGSIGEGAIGYTEWCVIDRAFAANAEVFCDELFTLDDCWVNTDSGRRYAEIPFFAGGQSTPAWTIRCRARPNVSPPGCATSQ